ncbi:MAG: flagellar basal body-associated FliL family protein [Saccharospirillaceae bacterium]|nr:flagellar basal body-associated FliL family protein [Pseudomonadales bacterium]NRB77850.1 flagellar basal body-associated FliL family protein [Saccharospirillaceae bacterium]
MADEDDKKEEGAEESTEKKGGLKKIILMAVGALLIAGISIAATLFLMPKSEPVTEEQMTPEELMQAEVVMGEDGEPISTVPIYLAMKPPFIANYPVGSRQRYLQMEISLFARDQETIDVAKLHEPLLRNNIISILGAQNYDTLRTEEGKLALIEMITVEIQDVLLEEMGRPGIEKILLTSFVLQ